MGFLFLLQFLGLFPEFLLERLRVQLFVQLLQFALHQLVQLFAHALLVDILIYVVGTFVRHLLPSCCVNRRTFSL